MAHGRKKWIRAVDIPGGRIKRSRHGSTQDKLGRLAIVVVVHRQERARKCDCCFAELGGIHMYRVADCSRCREAADARRRAGYDDGAWLRHAPKFYRRMLQGQFRARVKHLMMNERYDELPGAPRDAA